MIRNIKSLKESDFVLFLQNPRQEFYNKFSSDIIVFLIITAFKFLLLISKTIFTDGPFFDPEDLESLSANVFISHIFIVPLIEEFAFRGFLRFKSKFMFFLSSLAIMFLCFSFLKNENLKNISLVIIAIVGFISIINKSVYKKINLLITNNIRILIIVSSICFGLMHLTNYETFDWINLFGIFGKIIGGTFLCYIAIKYSIWHSFLFHALNNIIPFLLILMYYILN
ncbi:CPBP family intramembrane glutamic endopeptidase [Riemerella anatipestifer]|uniref:CPBP family intramembrane glutamic endopeptidase n=1 Tax=Riemerella anatipestifer TaxID=34085 RepID=UPI00129DAD6F|nr:CPBP family intramembrane glutamic endopeptidase [Riemerella anatipestifer]MRM82654.1 CPBP family intramembrane metalloprotease [Riemerella anatipestifer]